MTLMIVLAISIGLFLFSRSYPDMILELKRYGYPGAFLVGLVSSATVMLPFSGIVALVPLGTLINPILVGLAGGTGSAIGEMSSYLLGHGGRTVVENRKAYQKALQWLDRWGALAVFIFAVTPLPIDVVGIGAGLLKYPWWKFLLACWLGKSVMFTVVVLLGAWGWESLLGSP